MDDHRRRRLSRWRRLPLCVLVVTAGPAHAWAQAPAAPLTLVAAVDRARSNYPSLKELRARAAAAAQGVSVAQAAYVPRLDVLWQTNRATRNNVFGLLLPQAVVPPISGPVLGTTSYDSVWGSAGGVLLSWQAVDFGVRKANVMAARAQAALAAAQTEVTELDVTAAAADAFLTVLAADQVAAAARANVARLQIFAESVRTLVRNQLRPGADESRADAELAMANTQLSQAVQSSALARATLADAIGSAGTTFELDAASLAQLPAQLAASPPPVIDAHPAVRAATAAVETVHARERALARTYAPRVDLQSAFSGRGSGADVPGQPAAGSGLSLQVPNWAMGVTVSFPLLDFVAVNARKRVEAENEVAERARRDRTLQTVTTQNARARALMTAAAEIAQNTPIELEAATAAENRARARYSSGLANLTEVADAQRLLAQAEADNAMARLGVWRALLALTQAAGDLTPFLAQIRQP